jgi:hypothetical protein
MLVMANLEVLAVAAVILVCLHKVHLKVQTVVQLNQHNQVIVAHTDLETQVVKEKIMYHQLMVNQVQLAAVAVVLEVLEVQVKHKTLTTVVQEELVEHIQFQVHLFIMQVAAEALTAVLQDKVAAVTHNNQYQEEISEHPIEVAAAV